MDSGDDRFSTAGMGPYSALIPGPASALIDTQSQQPIQFGAPGILAGGLVREGFRYGYGVQLPIGVWSKLLRRT
jgi:hypothetical protein